MVGKEPVEIRNEINKCVINHDYSEGPLLLLSGPGTGKTYSLLETIKAKIKRKFNHRDFFEFTLTNAAANDFITDAKEQITSQFNSSSTLHYRAKGVLHRHAKLLNLKINFTVIDEKYEKLIFRDINYILRDSNINKELKEYREASAECLTIESDFSNIYQKLQYFYAAIDWVDVVKLVCHLLEENKKVREIECNKFKFLLIDEYQDLNKADQKFAELLLNGRSSLLAVGDDDQSIYSGRYANPQGIITFKDRYPNAKKLVLPVTSRIPSKIINASYSLISHNKSREKKGKLIPISDINRRADEGFIISVNLKSGKAEREFISEAIFELLKQGISPTQILVLCNCRDLGLELIDSIEESEISIPIQNDLKKLEEDSNSKKLLLKSISKFISNRDDNLSLRIILAKLLENYPSECSILVQESLKLNVTLWNTLNNKDIIEKLENSPSIISGFIKVIEEATKLVGRKEQLIYIFSHINKFNDLIRLLENKNRQKDNINKQENPNNTQESVRFMTLHSSKGLDADYIFIPFMEKSIDLPSVDIEEKRRLLYVAITRAKVGVIFSWAWSRRSDKRFKCKGDGGKVINRKPSSFIIECCINSSIYCTDKNSSPPEIAIKIISKSAACIHSFDANES